MTARERFAVNDRVRVRIRRGYRYSLELGTVRGFSGDGAGVRVQLDGRKSVSTHHVADLERE